MTSLKIESHHCRVGSQPDRKTFLLQRLVNRIKSWIASGGERRHLRSLDDRTLNDLGFSRMEAERALWDNNALEGK
jgi:uncharacterized protein YjiS (DUF1127 family)